MRIEIFSVKFVNKAHGRYKMQAKSFLQVKDC